MSKNAEELLDRGMQCLTEQMGTVDAEYFISLVIREQSDYTKWQRRYFDEKTPEEIRQEALGYNQSHPFQGKKAKII